MNVLRLLVPLLGKCKETYIFIHVSLTKFRVPIFLQCCAQCSLQRMRFEYTGDIKMN